MMGAGFVQNDADKIKAGLRVGITFNLKKNIASDLPDAEAELDDMDTIRALQGALESAGHTVTLFEAAEDLPDRLLRNRPDIVFNIAEGINGRGREAQVPAILNFLNIPFTGSDETTMCLAMDKALCKRLAASYGIDTPEYMLVKNGAPLPDKRALAGAGLSLPVIIKPNAEGSSKGITDLSVCFDSAALRRVLAEKINAYKTDMLLEEYIPGRELTVGILGNGDALRVFPPMEIIFSDKTRSIYSREVKKDFRRYVTYKCPADISPRTEMKITHAAETVYRALDCRDFARVDFRLSPAGRPCFIEINPLPGLAPEYSDFPMIAGFCGMGYAELIHKILNSALSRFSLFI